MIALAGYLGLVFYAGGTRQPEVTRALLEWDKTLHAAAFGVLHLLVLAALRTLDPGRLLAAHQALAALAASALGGALEIYQGTLPHRQPEILDWVADCAGILIVAGLVAVVHARRGDRSRS